MQKSQMSQSATQNVPPRQRQLDQLKTQAQNALGDNYEKVSEKE